MGVIEVIRLVKPGVAFPGTICRRSLSPRCAIHRSREVILSMSMAPGVDDQPVGGMGRGCGEIQGHLLGGRLDP